MRDVIYRQDVIDTLYDGMCGGGYCSIVSDIKALPSAHPTTTWLGSYPPYTCEKCSELSMGMTPYCPFCGRKAVNYINKDGRN